MEDCMAFTMERMMKRMGMTGMLGLALAGGAS